ncbi:Na+/H+ antiporter subunit E [Brevibacterium sp. 5221]|uniref:Na+/H+ antiporter subunit E n=1 Tax=Brevibacterium rongguiense TaxID=2695267 RepID=A0A6N9H8B1_9MICO|nr:MULTISPECIES: Na+/H+ antiporter subunit E [Brevibacterium]MYM20270.1 Na+/H+ antiporter subunit E [Brevibacterium rongguiense]WAL39734.1 Na+/H+ antiporter subunit E [Brevibacterium sp. BRM-1]
MAEAAVRGRERAVRALRQLLLITVLVALWVMLWEAVTPMTVLTGIIVSFGVTRAFYLPAFELSGRFNVWRFAVFVVWFAYSLVTASAEVAWAAIRPGRMPASSVVAVTLHVRSDLVLTVIAQVASLIPGSFVVEADRASSVLYMHALGCDSEADIAKVRAQTHRIELLVVAAIGSAHDLQVLNDWRAENGLKTVSEASSLRGRRGAAGRRGGGERP